MRNIQLLIVAIHCLNAVRSWMMASSSSVPIRSSRSHHHQVVSSCLSATVTGIESTPNPSSFLVKLSDPLVGLEDLAGSLRGRSYTTVSLLTPTEIASILNIDGIEEVYCMATALTINKKATTQWSVVLPLVLEALGGDSDIADQLLQGLLSSSSSDDSTASGQVRIRLQISNKIPIQIEGIGYLGTTKRVKLPTKFEECMRNMVDSNGDVDFFAGRKWIDRGVRYYLDDNSNNDNVLQDDEAAQEDMELTTVLQSELEEVDAAYSNERLDTIVAESLGKGTTSTDATSTVSATADLNLEQVDRYCDLAEEGSEEALVILANFVMSHKGSMPARRNALAYLGGTAGEQTNDAGDDLVFSAVASAFENEKNPIMRRTAGDAFSDLGDARAVPYAAKALESDRSKLVQWRAARILGELGDSQEVVAILKQASFSKDFAFEVAFEIKDAMRKVRARVMTEVGESVVAKGPMWKQIQEGTRKDSSS